MPNSFPRSPYGSFTAPYQKEPTSDLRRADIKKPRDQKLAADNAAPRTIKHDDNRMVNTDELSHCNLVRAGDGAGYTHKAHVPQASPSMYVRSSQYEPNSKAERVCAANEKLVGSWLIPGSGRSVIALENMKRAPMPVDAPERRG